MLLLVGHQSKDVYAKVFLSNTKIHTFFAWIVIVTSITMLLKALESRSLLKTARRIIVKIGSAIITENGELSAPRIARITEQIAKLNKEGRQVLLVSSGSVSFGRKILRSELEELKVNRAYLPVKVSEENRIAASVGQCSLMSYYENSFRLYDRKVSQILVTNDNFNNENERNILTNMIQESFSMRLIPIVNTNDALEDRISRLMPSGDSDLEQANMSDIIIGDNDALASLLAVELSCDLLIILSNVNGIYSGDPKKKSSRFFPNFTAKHLTDMKIDFAAKSSAGLGGMESKIRSALYASKSGTSVVICNGLSQEPMILKVVSGESVGTFIAPYNEESKYIDANGNGNGNGNGLLEPAEIARLGAKQLKLLGVEKRADMINEIANELQLQKAKIFEENKRDLVKAEANGIDKVLLARLKLTDSKIDSLTLGLKQIAKKSIDEVDKVLEQTRVSSTLTLQKVSCPVGVLLVIFESRPDCLPQISALAIATGNGLLLKGGSEASYSNKCLFNIISDILAKYNCADAVRYISSRDQISELLSQQESSKLSSNKIDLIIPRGSNALVREIQEKANGIPVLAHAEGICHVYIDKEIDNIDDAIRVVIDSKCNYPSACNAMETLLLHSSHIEGNLFKKICKALTDNDVKMNFGPKIAKHLPYCSSNTTDYRVEYGRLECTIECVDTIDEAIRHINDYGSAHTDAIVTSCKESEKLFESGVESACTFINCSTRFADGFRFGLGAEVGISTSSVHARGPAGMESLLIHKWVLKGQNDIVSEYDSQAKQYLHEKVV